VRKEREREQEEGWWSTHVFGYFILEELNVHFVSSCLLFFYYVIELCFVIFSSYICFCFVEFIRIMLFSSTD